jgi:PAS domain S-box-containing protein
MLNVLLVDDEPILLELGRSFLERNGEMAVETEVSAEEALRRPDLFVFDAIVADYEMSGMDGIAFLREVRHKDPHIPILIFTGRGREEVVIEAIDNGADFYVQKGGLPQAQFAELIHKIKKAVEQRRVLEELRLDEMRLEALFMLYQMTDTPLPDMMHYALEEGIRLTGSRIGYIAFVNEDETELEMYAWSASAIKECRILDKPKIYPLERCGLWGEAVRQRRPIITNDFAADNPLKKGYPEGHVSLIRHMNVPVFDGDRIVAVAGVGNKPRPYDDGDVLQLSLLMGGMWQIIKRKRNEEQLKKNNEVIAAHCSRLAEHEAALRESEERFSFATDVANIGVWEFDIRTDEAFTNPKFNEILGYVGEDRIRTLKEWEKIVDPEDLPRLRHLGEKHREGKRPSHDTEFRVRCRDGSRKWVHSVARISQRDREGRPLRITGIMQDVTEKRIFREQLEEANRKLILLSDVTRHDILNQVTAILGNVMLLREIIPLEGDPQRFVDAIEVLTKTIQDQITFTSEYQQVGVRPPEWQCLRDVVARAALSVPLDTIELTIDTGTVEVFADPMIERVILNILINASLHGEEVTHITASFIGKDVLGVLVIEDDGVGISPGQKKTIFQRGFGKNTGFGLFLAREILQINSMSICETSEGGEGARFEIKIPAGLWRRTP